MSETLRYYPMDELRDLSLAELTALWELVPTERQRRYKAVYDREVRNAGASGSDALEQQVAGELLTRYADSALVPIGARWARCPVRIQEVAKRSADLVAPETLVERETSSKPHPILLLIGGAVFALVLLLFLTRLGGRGNRVAQNLTLTPTATLSPTPRYSPTPTPIALENQDPVIRGGDSDRSVAYPVNLRVTLADSAVLRVFVVQRRVVQTAEWNFDPNPDTASYIAGLTVRPVIGVPHSPENTALFARTGTGTTFTLQMNTGATLRFVFASKTEVVRSDTGIFRQVEPGLVLVLVGERGIDGMPTATRIVVTATYPTEQELSRIGVLSEAGSVLPTPEATATPAATATPVLFERLDVLVLSVTIVPGRVTVQLRIYNDGVETAQITPDTIWMAFGYAPNPPGPRVPADGLAPFALLSGQAADMTIHWAWAGERYAMLGIGMYRHSLEF
jgi:hypothetical protein